MLAFVSSPTQISAPPRDILAEAYHQRASTQPGRTPRVVIRRHRSLAEETHNVEQLDGDWGLGVGIIMRRTNLRISASDRVIHDGPALPGLVYATGPGVPAHCLFRGSHDSLHLQFAIGLLIENEQVLPAGSAAAGTGARVFQDPVIERLGLALVTAEQMNSPYGLVYAESIGAAIVTRLLASQAGSAPAGDQPASAGLVKWRLKRTLDFIEANLAEPLGLADIALAAGLTRMHFAAQFRAATGLRPHEYVLRRRIERAQEILLTPNASVVDVALQVGFQTQAHFTTVFKRFVGQPPHAWRQCQDRAA